MDSNSQRVVQYLWETTYSINNHVLLEAELAAGLVDDGHTDEDPLVLRAHYFSRPLGGLGRAEQVKQLEFLH